MKVQKIERDLEYLPKERETAKASIAKHEAGIESLKQAIKELEVQSKSLETEMGEIESQVVRYKNQQLQVKKNEEYQALTHEIETAQGKISDLEEKEIELLYELDQAKEDFKTGEAELNEKIDVEKKTLGRLDDKEANLKSEIDGAKAVLAEVEAETSKQELSVYRRVSRGMKFPILVALSDWKCGGCHMKVSAYVRDQVRKGEEITTCDNCGRILYWEE